MRLPSVAGVELHGVALGWRLARGTPSWPSVFQMILPVALSSASSRHWWTSFFFQRRDVPVEPHLQFRLPRLHRRSNINAVAPHNRARVSQAGQRSLPKDVRACFNVPVRGRCLALIYAARTRPAILWPIAGVDKWTGARDCRQQT